MLEDVKTIKFTSRPGYGLDGIVIDGLFRDFSVKEKTGSSDCEAGTLASGFGGLEYSNKEDFYHGITRTFSALAKEHNFGFYCNGANKHLSTISKQEAHVKQREIQMGQFGAIVFAALFFVGVAIYGANRRDNKPEIPQFDQSTIVRPQRDATGQYDYVLPNTKSYQHTCYTTAYPGSDTVTSKAFGCNIIDDSRASVAIKNVEWSDGIQTRFTIVGSRASIATNGNFSSADWSIVTHEGVRYYLFEADEGASTWIPYNIH